MKHKHVCYMDMSQVPRLHYNTTYKINCVPILYQHIDHFGFIPSLSLLSACILCAQRKGPYSLFIVLDFKFLLRV